MQRERCLWKEIPVNYYKSDDYHLGTAKIKWNTLFFKWHAQGKVMMSCTTIGSEFYWKEISLKRVAPGTESCSDSGKIN